MSKNKIVNKSSKILLEEYLIQNCQVESPKKAQALVLAGEVFVNGQKVRSSKIYVHRDDVVELKNPSKYVSRAGEKIEGIVELWKLFDVVKEANILDVGSSTGGFTDFFLQHGAKKVFCVDVGTNQLAWKIRNDPRVEVFEQTDIRQFDIQSIKDHLNIISMDLSFISLEKVLKDMLHKLQPSKKSILFLVLLKPQFELPKHQVPEGGVVIDPLAVDMCNSKFDKMLKSHKSISEIRFAPSPLKGRTGNQEYFFSFKLN